jgi:hypothetical protein
MAVVAGGHGWFAIEGRPLGHTGWFELERTCLEMDCMRGVKSRVGANCARKGKGFDEEGDGGDTLHDRGRGDALQSDVGRNQGSKSGPWAGMSSGGHLHTRGQRWRLYVRPSTQSKLNIGSRIQSRLGNHKT